MVMKMSTPFLLPLALIYGGITALRNYFFEWGILKSTKTKHKSIGVGNLSVGGTGKSVVIDYLISLFKNKYNLAILVEDISVIQLALLLLICKVLQYRLVMNPFSFLKSIKG